MCVWGLKVDIVVRGRLGYIEETDWSTVVLLRDSIAFGYGSFSNQRCQQDSSQTYNDRVIASYSPGNATCIPVSG
jgi:hypothetical protein